jgi:nucleotide-binding universal stress UspA family protein
MAEQAAQWTPRKILLATDGSPSSIAATRVAVGFARTHSAELIVLHVVDDQILEELSRFSQKSDKETGKILEENGWNYLREVEETAQEQWVETSLQLRHGTPHEVLLETAKKKEVDLIIMGKSGQRGPRRVLTGSVTQRVMDLSDVPVLVVK